MRSRQVTSKAIASFLLLACLSLLPTAPSWAQEFPNRPVRLIVSFPAGGSVDVLGRVLAQFLQEAWSHQVIVDNKAGAGGIIATEAAAKAPPDGYTLFLTIDGPMVINPFVYKTLPYDPIRDFVPVAPVASAPLAIVASPVLVNAGTLSEFVAYAKNNPGRIDYASSGIGGPHHLAMELFKSAAGIDLNHIPYKGGSPALQDVVAGRVAVMFSGVSTHLSYIKSGKLKVFAVGSAGRSALAPEVPTVAELGYPGFEAGSWFGIVAPKGSPRDAVERIQSEISRITRLASFREKLAAAGFEPLPGSAEDFRALIQRDYEKNSRLIRGLKIRAD